MCLHPSKWHRFVAAALLCLVLATVTVAAEDSSASQEGATELHVHLGAARSAPEHVRCGFDEIEARTRPSRVMGISRIVRPDAPHRNIDAEASPMADSAAWEPIRIRVYTQDLEDSAKYCTAAGQTRPNFQGRNVTCTDGDVLTSTKKVVLTQNLIPPAIQLHQDRLNVQPVSGNIVVDAASFSSDSICGQFTIPWIHTSTGVSDADFVLYMSSGPTEGNIAWATTCQLLPDGRPSVGASNVSPKYISEDPQTVRVIAHEILHALGFGVNFFRSQKMYSTASIGGKGSSPVLTSPNVVAEARAQYGCKTQTFMELEDMGGRGTAYSHWKRRSAKDELMAGISGIGRYTALTIAAMEDTGFYKGNYANAESMSYGQNAGCELTTSKCIVNGVSQFPDMFCTDTSSDLVCTSGHTAMGICYMKRYTTALPSYFQYFRDPFAGGGDALMDYCPYIQEFTNTNCHTDGGVLMGNTYGVNSRCLNVPDGVVSGVLPTGTSQHAICANVQCGNSTYGVKVLGASNYTACTPGATMSLSSLSSSFSSGSLVCPDFKDMCFTLGDRRGDGDASTPSNHTNSSTSSPTSDPTSSSSKGTPICPGSGGACAGGSNETERGKSSGAPSALSTALAVALVTLTVCGLLA